MNASIMRFMNEEDGVTALEYGLLAAVVAGILVTVARTELGELFEGLFEKLADLVDSATETGTG